MMQKYQGLNHIGIEAEHNWGPWVNLPLPNGHAVSEAPASVAKLWVCMPVELSTRLDI